MKITVEKFEELQKENADLKMAKTGKLQNMKPIEELFSENPSGERVQNRTDNRRVPFSASLANFERQVTR